MGITREKSDQDIPQFLSGGGEMGHRIREYDWASTSIGPIETWPHSLRTCIRIMLTSRQPVWIGWGKELIKFYNDPYKSIVGGKHPWALGKPASQVWKDIWDDIEPLLRQVMEENEGNYSESQLLIMERNGYPEETYYTFSYTPIPGDDGRTEGMFCANTDDTDRIISERQLKTLTLLGKSLTDCKSEGEVFERAINSIQTNPHDFPYAIFRKIRDNKATLVTSTQLGEAKSFIPVEINLDDDDYLSRSIKMTIESRRPHVFDNIHEHLGIMPKGAWPIPPNKAVILPLFQTGIKEPYATISIGLNPYRLPDEKYLSFLTLIADQVTASYADVRAFEEEKRRAEALSEIDKAKTAFFTNISHEFRTPLTLILGSLEQQLRKNNKGTEDQQQLETTHRNALRLLRLVNNLLDFSRLEAGRTKAFFQQADIATYTNELASNFRSAIEAAGLSFNVDTPAVKERVYIDREMWEKVVLNLLSNAYKYTLKGSISVSLDTVPSINGNGSLVRLLVKDTGVGIPPAELPKMFQRFHRIENATGRSFEGTGIGLSLVKELVHLHKGEISVNSEEGKGSEFTVLIPTGKAHLDLNEVSDEQLEFDATIAEAFIEEASSLLDKDVSSRDLNTRKDNSVLVVDDNADMRNYIRNLLQDNYNVILASNGKDALEKMKDEQPDLVLSDIMMPVMDGVDLLKAIKGNPATNSLPVILLSARAGEEERIEGYEIGADDYLVKPFSAKELLARVSAQVHLKDSRNALLKKIYNVFDEVPFAVGVLMGPELIIEFINKYNLRIWNKTREEVLGKSLYSVFPGNIGSARSLHEEIYRSGKRSVANEIPIELYVNGTKETRYFDAIIDPMENDQGIIIGQLATSIDVTEKVMARKKTEENEVYFRHLVDAVPAIIWITDTVGYCTYLNHHWYEYTGQTRQEAEGFGWLDATHPDDKEEAGRIFLEANKAHTPFRLLYRLRSSSGDYRWAIDSGSPRFNADGKFEGYIGTVVDVHEQKLAEEKIREAEERYSTTVNASELGLWDYDVKQQNLIAAGKMALIHGMESNEEYSIEALREIIHPEDIETQISHFKAVFESGKNRSFTTEYRIIQRNTHHVRWVKANGYAFFDEQGQLYRTVGTVADITEQKEVENAIRQSEGRFRTLAETLPEMVWVTDEKGTIEYFNNRWEAFSGVKDVHEAWKYMIHPDDAEISEAGYQQAYNNGIPFRLEVRLRNKAGEYRWHTTIAEPVKDSEGKIVKWVGSITDIHDQKTISEKLEKLVLNRTTELHRSNEDLQQFAHVASHDLKEPVRKIRTFGSRLIDEFGDQIPAKAKTYISKIDAAAGRMYSMIDGVLSYSSLNAIAQVNETVDLNEVFRNIESDLEIMIQQKEATIKYKDLPLVEGSQVLIFQLFYNLVSNSLKFSRQGVSPVILVSHRNVKSPNGDRNEFVEITLEDNGIGFNQDDAENIFQTFYRLNSKDQFEGTGLGLALCKKIAERHGGTISARSREGEGSRFIVTLPKGEDS